MFLPVRRRARDVSRRFQDVFRRSQDASRRLQDAPRRVKDAKKTLRYASKTLFGVASKANRAPAWFLKDVYSGISVFNSPNTSPRRLKTFPRRLKTPPRRLQDECISVQDASKTQDAFRTPQDVSKSRQRRLNTLPTLVQKYQDASQSFQDAFTQCMIDILIQFVHFVHNCLLGYISCKGRRNEWMITCWRAHTYFCPRLQLTFVCFSRESPQDRFNIGFN